MSELLPCPFCGGGAKLFQYKNYWFVACEYDLDSDDHCACEGRGPETRYGAEEAIARWNRRTPPIVGEDARDAGRWVPWKPGDALPEDGVYWTTAQVWGGRSNDVRPSIEVCERSTKDHTGRPWQGWDVRAYWSAKRPPPYDAAMKEGKA